ncbi:transposase [Myxosarcina sp. GI1(2024)]
MKTIEFKLYLNARQQSQIDNWLEILKVVWNRALAILEWKQWRDRYQKCMSVPDTWGFEVQPTAINCYKLGKDYILYTPIAADFRLNKSKGWEVEGNTETRYSIDLVKSHWIKEPLISRYSAIDLQKPFAQKRYPWLKEQDIPMILVNDYLGLVVMEAWKCYQQGKARKPKYKKYQDKIRTLASESFRAQGRCDWENNRVKLPKLGWLKVKGLSTRITPGADISTFKIVRKASGYYLQLGWVDAPPRKKRARQVAGNLELSLSQYKDKGQNFSTPIPSYLEKSFKKLSQEQQKLSRCQYGSNRWQKQSQKVSQIHEKIKAQRESWQHWHSSRITDIYSDLAISIVQNLKTVPKPDPKLNRQTSQTYDPNGAEKIAEINRHKSDSALGNFKVKIKQKLVEGGNITETSISDKKKAKLAKQTNKTQETAERVGLASQSALKNSALHIAGIPPAIGTVERSGCSNQLSLKEEIPVNFQNFEKSIGKQLSRNSKGRKSKRSLNKKRKRLQDSLEANLEQKF